LIVGEGMWLVLASVIVGVAGGVALTGLLSGLLYDVAPRDPAIFAVVSVTLAVVALAATLLPARRATRVPPMAALRES
jgi:putative ABC transport system permease protein